MTVSAPSIGTTHVTRQRGVATGHVAGNVRSGLRADQRMQPGGVPAHAPTGLVGHDPTGLTQALADRLGGRLTAGGGPQHGVDAATPATRRPQGPPRPNDQGMARAVRLTAMKASGSAGKT